LSLREKIVAAVAVALGLGALAFAFLDDRGLREVRRLRTEKQKLVSEIGQLRARTQALEQNVSSLRGDRKAIEGKARNELGMIRKGETVFLLPERHDRKP
jgi:cell division protein FtsB